MADIEEMRRWARGEGVQGLPIREFKADPVEQPSLSKVLHREYTERAAAVPASASAPPAPAKRPPPKYKISADGSDALIGFGKHRDKALSEIGKTDFSYLDFIIKDDFPDDLKDVARHVRALLIKKSKEIKVFEE